jgi:FlaG/FlaF family flagellin (archaellin)
MKRGMSSVIGAILLVMLVVMVGSMIFLWMKHSVMKAEEEVLVQQECQNVKFVVADFCYEDVIIENIDTGDFKEKTRIKFNGRNDASEPELYGFLIFVDYQGSTVSIPSSPYTGIEGYNSKSVTTDFIEDIEGINQIRVVPKIKSKRKVFICEEKEMSIKWEDVEQC